MDMLIEEGLVITLDELEAIVLEYIHKGILFNDNLHKYVQYLSIAKVYHLPVSVWKQYLSEILQFSNKIFSKKLPECEDPQENVNDLISCFIDVYKNTCVGKGKTLTKEFERILQITFSDLEGFVNNSESEMEKDLKRVH